MAAAQRGTLMAAAKWLDIAVDNPVDGCFGVETGENRLSGLSDDFAVTQSEGKQSVPSSTIEAPSDCGKISSVFTERVQRAHVSQTIPRKIPASQ